MKKLFVVLTLAMFSVSTAYAEFCDIPGGIEKDRIEYLEKKGIIKGVGEDKFEPEKTVTRAEFAAMVNRAMGYDNKEGINKFSDISPDKWYYGDVLAVAASGVIDGFPDATFKPEENISHEQAVKILVSIYETKYSVEPSGDMATDFDDYYEISDWARSYVSKGTMLSIAKGYGDEILKFKPQSDTTRIEAGNMLYSMLNAIEVSEKADIRWLRGYYNEKI